MGRTLRREEASGSDWAPALKQCRDLSLRLVHGLSDADATVQSMDYASPSKWHLAHSTWFFEESVLVRHVPGYRVFHESYRFLFNSYFEADAYARWAGKRLPTEFEWEAAARTQPVEGHFLSSRMRPSYAPAGSRYPLKQLFGDVWEWTASPYVAYPGFRPAAGAVGEYNGKFMNGQYVLRGGSCATPAGHVRATYRNFFYPHQRWQFMGLRLAEDRS